MPESPVNVTVTQASSEWAELQKKLMSGVCVETEKYTLCDD